MHLYRKKRQVDVFLVYSHHIFAVILTLLKSSVNYCRKTAASLLQVNEVWQWHVKISLQTFWQCRAVLRMLDFPGLIQYNISKLNLSWAFYYGNKSKCKCHTKFCFFFNQALCVVRVENFLNFYLVNSNLSIYLFIAQFISIICPLKNWFQNLIE